MPFGKLRTSFDRLSTNGTNYLPFVLSLSKVIFRGSQNEDRPTLFYRPRQALPVRDATLRK